MLLFCITNAPLRGVFVNEILTLPGGDFDVYNDLLLFRFGLTISTFCSGKSLEACSTSQHTVFAIERPNFVESMASRLWNWGVARIENFSEAVGLSIILYFLFPF
jgi:hypothetical protein